MHYLSSKFFCFNAFWLAVSNRRSSTLFALPLTPIFQVVVGDGLSLFRALIQTHLAYSVVEVQFKV